MAVHHVLILAALIPSLALDTFALAAALGVAGLPRQVQLRTSLVLAAFEGGMPIVGFLVGAALGHFLGYFAGWTAIAFLLAAGILMLRPGNEEKEQTRLRLLAKAQGLAIFDLGLSISIDELAIGFSIGLIGLPLLLAVAWIAVQAFVAAQLGIRLGRHVGEELRERSEQFGGIVVIVMALLLLGVKLVTGTV